jgi:ribosomal protein L37AE/L43A
MDDIISNMGDTVFAVGLVVVLFVFAFLTAAVRSSRTKEYLKKHPIKKCPFCAELVKLEAKVCKHCGRDFAPVSKQPAAEQIMQAAPSQKPTPVSTIPCPLCSQAIKISTLKQGENYCPHCYEKFVAE